MSAAGSYATLFDAIGHYLDGAGATNVLVDQIEGGYLLGFDVGRDQRMVTLDEAELTRLQAAAARPHKSGGFRLFGRRSSAAQGVRADLRAVGRFLDGRRAEAVIIQQQADGFIAEFTSVPENAALREVARLTETIDADALSRLR